MTDISIHTLTEQDFPAFTNLTLEIFGQHKRALAEGTFKDALTNIPARPHILVAKSEEKVIGGVIMTPVLPLTNYTTFGISWLCISPEYRGRGYSKKLMNEAEDYIIIKLLDGHIGDILLSTAVGTEFYAKHGYRVAYLTYKNVPVLVKTIRRKP